MTTRQKTRNLGQHPRLLRRRRDSYVDKTAVSVAIQLMTHSAMGLSPGVRQTVKRLLTGR